MGLWKGSKDCQRMNQAMWRHTYPETGAIYDPEHLMTPVTRYNLKLVFPV